MDGDELVEKINILPNIKISQNVYNVALFDTYK